MKTRGKLANLSLSYLSGKAVVSFEVTARPEEIEAYKDLDLDIDFKKHREKRSLDANAYYWALVAKLAYQQRITKEEVHEINLQSHPIFKKTDDGKYITIAMKADIPIELLPGHWTRFGNKNGLVAYGEIKGSSEMNTAEFSRLLDGIIYECRINGIETLTPREMYLLEGYVPYGQS